MLDMSILEQRLDWWGLYWNNRHLPQRRVSHLPWPQTYSEYQYHIQHPALSFLWRGGGCWWSQSGTILFAQNPSTSLREYLEILINFPMSRQDIIRNNIHRSGHTNPHSYRDSKEKKITTSGVRTFWIKARGALVPGGHIMGIRRWSFLAGRGGSRVNHGCVHNQWETGADRWWGRERGEGAEKYFLNMPKLDAQDTWSPITWHWYDRGCSQRRIWTTSPLRLRLRPAVSSS